MKSDQNTAMQKLDNSKWARNETCDNCKNQFIVLWLRQADDWNDFGYRHCPFCGWAFDEITGAVLP